MISIWLNHLYNDLLTLQLCLGRAKNIKILVVKNRFEYGWLVTTNTSCRMVSASGQVADGTLGHVCWLSQN